MYTRKIKATWLAVIVVAILLPMPSWANTDSLLLALSKARQDTHKVNTLIALSSAEMKSSPAKALEYSKQAAELATELEFRVGESRALAKSGSAHKLMGQYVQAVDCFSKAAEIDRSIGRKRGMAAAYGNIGHVYGDQGLYEQALEYYNKVHDIFLELKDTMNLAGTYSAIGTVKQDQGDWSAAMENALEARRLFEQLHDSVGIAMCLHNIGIVRYQLGEKKEALEDFKDAMAMNKASGNANWLVNNLMAIVEVLVNMDQASEAMPYLLEAADVAQAHDDVYSLGLIHDQMGSIHEKQGNHQKALESYLVALEIREKIDDKKGIGNSRLSLGILNSSQGNTTEALHQLELAEAMFRSIGANEELAETYRAQSDANAKAGRFEAAWASERKFAEIKDSILTVKMQELKAKMETATKLKTIEQALELEQLEVTELESRLAANRMKVNFLVVLGILGFLLLVFILLLFLQRRQLTIKLELQNEDISRKLWEKEQMLMEAMAPKESRTLPDTFKALSQREMEVVYYLSTGLKDKEIAESLFISLPTVKTHLARIYRKLEVKSRAEVVALVHQNAIFAN
jgi:tetratricopeptide (TPR) repeat protein